MRGATGSSSETFVVTLGERAYAIERTWGQWPEGVPQGLLSQVAVDGMGRVHLLQRTAPAVVVFEPDGRFAFTYGTEASDGHGISADDRGRLLIADRDAHQILVYGQDGELLFRLGERHCPRWQAPFNHPTAAAVAADGRIFVADGYGNARVHRFSGDGVHEHAWGSLGRAGGQFMTPHAIAIDGQGRVLVADRENGRIQVFTEGGELLHIWGGLQNPMALWIDPEGRVLVTDQVPSLVLFSPAGEVLGRCRPSLNGAHGLFGSPTGDLFLTEMTPPSLTRLRRLDR